MCLICSTRNIQDIIDITTLICCPIVTRIPSELINLVSLDCSFSDILEVIPKELVKLEYLVVTGCIKLNYIPRELVNLIHLNICYCHLIKNIPKELVKLDCLQLIECPLIKSIPKELDKLSHLNCSNCISVEYIPDELVRLFRVFCDNCPLLKNIPRCVMEIECKNCHLLTQKYEEFTNRNTYDFYFWRPNNRWMNYPRNQDYKTRIKKLIKCQKYFKKCISNKKIKRNIITLVLPFYKDIFNIIFKCF